VRRIELLDDDALDDFRRRFPDASAAAMDESLALEHELERQLAVRDDIVAEVEQLAARPLLSVHVCLACGARVIAETERPWVVDRLMQATGAAERDVRSRG
jgi:hypothetical protein